MQRTHRGLCVSPCMIAHYCTTTARMYTHTCMLVHVLYCQVCVHTPVQTPRACAHACAVPHVCAPSQCALHTQCACVSAGAHAVPHVCCTCSHPSNALCAHHVPMRAGVRTLLHVHALPCVSHIPTCMYTVCSTACVHAAVHSPNASHTHVHVRSTACVHLTHSSFLGAMAAPTEAAGGEDTGAPILLVRRAACL